MKLKTSKARGWFALSAATLILMVVFAVALGENWWFSVVMWTGVFAWIAFLAIVVPRIMTWIEKGD